MASTAIGKYMRVMYSQKLQLRTLNNYELYTRIMVTMDPLFNKSNNSKKLPNLSSAKRS